MVRGNFQDIKTIAKENGFTNVSGILFDLGVSSFQLDTPEKGFSYRFNGPLDMRMDKTLGVTAADLLGALSKKELATIFFRYADESTVIVEERKKHPIKTTEDLVRILAKAGGIRGELSEKTRAGIATKVFQALRIAVNDELGALGKALPASLSLLKSGGVLAVITFHSLEDRIVKDTFKKMEEEEKGVVQESITPTQREIEENKRSRSARLRIIKKN